MVQCIVRLWPDSSLLDTHILEACIRSSRLGNSDLSCVRNQIIMKSAFAVACILAAVTLASGRLISIDDLTLPGLGDAPDFCHGLECPPFKLLKNTSNYQLREYEGGKPVQETCRSSVHACVRDTMLITDMRSLLWCCSQVCGHHH